VNIREEGTGKIVIIGAGLAGLTAGWKLAEAFGRRVVLLERESFTGGMAHTFSEGEISYDFGSHRIHPSYAPEAMALIREVIGESLLLRERGGKLRLNDRYMNYPPDLGSFLRGLGIGVSLRGAASFLAARLSSRPARGGAAELSYEECMRRRAGKVIYELLYSPYAWKVYGIDPRIISAHAAKTRVSLKKPLAVARDLLSPKKEKKFFYYPDGGIGRIGEELEKRFLGCGGELLTGVSVEAVRVSSRRISEVLFRRAGRVLSIPADIVVSTIPVHDLVQLLSPGVPSGVAHSALALRWRAIRFLYLCLQKEFCCEAETYYFPEMRYIFGRISEPKRFSPHMVRADGKTLICIEVLCNVADHFWQMPDRELLGHVLGDLKQLGIIASGKEISRVFSKALPAVYPIYDLSWQENLQSVHRFLGGIPNLYLIGRGSLFLHDNMDHAIRMGQMLGEFVASNRDKNREWPEVAAAFRHFEVRD